MQRLALFDLDSTLVDRAGGLRLWAQEFCSSPGASSADVEWLIKTDVDGLLAKEVFFARVRNRFSLRDSVADPRAEYRRRHPTSIPLREGVAEGLSALRTAGLGTIWISRGRGWPRGTDEPDHTVDAVADAFAFLLTR